ncbi:MAG: BadF/BadG/BcrA/BcrD ATPase family protein [Armatimonadota bacterium]
MRCILGLDTGGTKCDAFLVRDDGVALGWSHYTVHDPEAKRQFGGRGRSKRSIIGAIREAFTGHNCDELHLIGLRGTLLPLGAWKGSEIGSIMLDFADEYDIPLALMGEPRGIVALAGTGAFIHGIRKDGEILHLDALGPMLGDYGGGYQIGALAVRAVAKSGWHPRHHTSLAGVIFPKCAGVENDPQGYSLIHFMHGERDRSDISTLAQLVNEHAEAGDRIAIDILKQAADGLAETLFDVVDSLGMAEDDCALVGTGGVAQQSRIYWEHFCARAKEIIPNARPMLPDLPPAVGMALIRLRKISPVDPQTMERNLFESARAMINAKSDHQP